MNEKPARKRRQGRGLVKGKGTCRECFSQFKLHSSDGAIRRHGHRSDPCPGSAQPPANQPVKPTAFLTGASVVGNVLSTPHTISTTIGTEDTGETDIGEGQQTSGSDETMMKHPNVITRSLKLIPKGARSDAGRLLTNNINIILSDPDEIDSWRNLLAFAAMVLELPNHCGKRHNLTSNIRRRITDFHLSLPIKLPDLFDQDRSLVHPQRRRPISIEHTMAAAVSAKIEEGNIRAATRILCSGDAPAPTDNITFEELRSKHPSPPSDRPPMPTPSSSAEAFQTTEAMVFDQIRHFPPGSSAGPDGLKPQHILEMITTKDSGPELLSAITGLINILLQGKCPPELRPILFGVTLFALRKKTGGLRPIAIGYYWRRLASKCANKHASHQAAAYLSPKQLGVGVPGGSEAAVHATRRFVADMDEHHIVVKLDLCNAFNSLYRDRMLASVFEILPDLAPYSFLAYAEESTLRFGGYTIKYRVGPQQGDPLGPLLFCLPLQPILLETGSSLAFGYLDDLTLGGRAETVAADVEFIEKTCSTMGLTLNRSKFKVITHNNISISHDALRDFKQIEVKEAQLLGAPLSSETALQQCLKARTKELEENLSKLALIVRQDALLILRSSLGSPKMIHTLRCHPSNKHPELETYDTNLRRGLEQILNVSLNDLQWTQASLPIKMGGLGIRRASSLALPAFLASAASTLPLQTLILTSINLIPNTHILDMTSEWCSKSDFKDGDSMPTHKQALWDRPLLQQTFKKLLNDTADPYNTARLKAVSSPHASDWLYALPITACGLRVEDEDVRVAVGLRLGVAICEPHMCACGARIDSRGSHGLSCSLGFGRILRHSTIKDIIHRSLSKAGIPSIKEPPGLTRTDGRRPDGLTMIPWRAGRHLVWDATVVDTLAPSYVQASATMAGSAAEIATERKNSKYSELLNTHFFVPIALETLGPINVAGHNFLSELGRSLMLATGDNRETCFLYQRLSITIQRFNSVAFQGTLPGLNMRKTNSFL